VILKIKWRDTDACAVILMFKRLYTEDYTGWYWILSSHT